MRLLYGQNPCICTAQAHGLLFAAPHGSSPQSDILLSGDLACMLLFGTSGWTAMSFSKQSKLLLFGLYDVMHVQIADQGSARGGFSW